MGPKRFYRLDSNRNKFRVISYRTDVLALCDGYSSRNREFTLYLEANCDEPTTQIGSSNPIAVVGDEKGKGVAIEGGVSPRFDEEDWAEVFKLVDNYGEGAGWNCDQGVMQVDLQREGEGSGHSKGVGEGDSLHESEYGPEGEENGENMDEEGVQKGDQESSESDNSSDSDFCVSEDDFDSEWLSGKYEESFRTDSNRNVKGFRKDIIIDIRCHVSKHQAYRTKRKALNAIEGRAEDQFDQLWDYAAELRASNPRSTVIMAMTEGDDGTDRRKFEKLYGPHGGILLTVVLIDLNNNLYPLAYAVVSGETRNSWPWFLELLKGDLNVVRDHTYTFISDKQKSLIPAFESVFPGATNRFCVRHLHNNMKTAGFKGLAFKKTLWNAARATTLHEFNFRMEEMGHLDPKAVDWLSDKPPEHWSRSLFNCFPKCDMLLNNIFETFNSCILEAREKPILTMLEWIREFIMTRLSDNRHRARKKWSGKTICPRIRKIVEKNIDKAADCIPIKSDDWNYDISSYDSSRYVVNLQQHTCTCRKWDLTGIPCNHGMSAICSQSLEPEDFVNPCYSVETFLEEYKHAILPVNGPQLWIKPALVPPLPPNFGRRSGRHQGQEELSIMNQSTKERRDREDKRNNL
ncbi:UNVERIFIED_CONTAM: hypothetical protein Sradi_0877600 [Sesamum radiatum]|uniref:SWIM-type domain-containing protein n=1 Tax=Sesamum radiatum TaxID=300843 RepID=A0AAW2V2M1_SESRA